MKKTLLIALLLIPFLGMSQTAPTIDGFLGIKFGSTKAAVTAALKARGAVLDKENSTATILAFENVKLGSRVANGFVTRFVDDHVYSATFSFTPEDQPQTIEYYNKIVADLNDKYGKGTANTDFKSPYKFGDGHEVTAIQGGYGTMFTDWKIGNGSIQAQIKHDEDELSVLLIYTDDTVQAKVDAASKASQKSDF